MKRIYGSRDKLSRLLIIICALCVYIVLEITNALQMLYEQPTSSFSVFWLSFIFGLFSLTSLIFLMVGALVWLYARERHVASLLFAFSIVMMIIFTSLANLNANQTFSNLGSVSAIIALTLISIIMFYFPQNLLLASLPNFLGWRIFFVCYLFISSTFTIVCSLIELNVFGMYGLRPIVLFYYILTFGIIASISVFSYIKLNSGRKKQQMRIFVYGLIISLLPLFLLTLVPSILNLTEYTIAGDYTSLAWIIFPLALGYSVVRYQLLVLDTYIRRVVSSIIGMLSLAILVYVEVVCIDLMSSTSISLVGITCIGISIAIFAPFIWWLSRIVTDRLLFPESIHYNRLIQKPSLVSEEVLNVDDVARLITTAAIHTFEVPQVCLLTLDETAACYQLSPVISNSELDTPRLTLFATLRHIIAPSSHKDTYWLDVHLPALQRLLESRRPMLLSEIALDKEKLPRGLDRFMNADPPLGKDDYLLAPLRVQGQMIGILILGERADNQPYAGPDFEVAQMLTGRFASLLENARLYERANKSAALLNSVYTVSTRSGSSFNNIEDVATTYVVAAAHATATYAEIWLYNEQKGTLRRTAHAGNGPPLKLADYLLLTRESDWQPYFFSSQEAVTWDPERIPSCLSGENVAPSFSFAWLPLEKNQRRIGVLALTYERPHYFGASEMRVLELFATQGSAIFEDVRVAIELRTAYEQQKKLDVLKDQFIMIASHELRTPLTAVQGYIELLCEHREMLTPETQVEFLEKARVGCDELALMVGNIMDANLVHVDVSSIYMRPVLLQPTVLHVLDILDATIQREKRSVPVSIAGNLSIFADDMRLRQILLNLISNALKYSTPGTDIEISAVENDIEVHISVRDYGLGIPPGKQQQLFERFMRLERDLNSPVRGAGLGLYICDQLVKVMGGRIWIESSGIPGEGSTFTFVLQRVSLDQTLQAEVVELPTY